MKLLQPHQAVIQQFMSKLQQARPRRFCHKTRHLTEQYAQYHIMSLERAGALNLGPDEKLVTYRCVNCGYWHIGRSHSHGVFIPRLDYGFRQLDLNE